MKVAVITDSSNFLSRALFIARHFLKSGHEVTLIYSDFDHASKKKIKDAPLPGSEGINLRVIRTHPYKKNISIKRLYYHLDFALRLKAVIGETRPDLIYALIPSNSIAPVAARKARLLDARLIFDIIDLWPESLPVNRFKNTLPFRFWARLRDKCLPLSDLVITECELYKEVLNLPDALVMYWIKDKSDISLPEDTPVDNKRWRIAYLGAINNIIDTEEIVRILSALLSFKPLRLDIVGDGEKREEFLSLLSAAGIDFFYHGAIYDAKKKGEILSCCDWGLNIMKPGVCAGLSMKSLDYMAAGLRLINNIPGDTYELIKREGIGVNIDKNQGAEEIVSFDGCDKERVRQVFYEHFSIEAADLILSKAESILGI